MSWQLLVRPAAENDMAAARDWYEKRRVGLGDEYLDEIVRGLAYMQADPTRERLYYRNFRRVLLRRFPYKIFYQVMGSRIVIFRVLHAKQEHQDELA